jgi:putative DNA primase/helicase
LVPRVGVGLLNGPSGSGKTYVAVDAAMAVANGSAYANNHPTEKGRVLYAAGEDRTGVARRIIAHSQHSGLSDAGIGVWQGVSLAGLHDIEHLVSLGNRYDFVINDTLSRATPGLDENSNSEMAAAIDRVYQLSAAWRCFVLIVSHTGKDAAKGVRGASALVANVDTVLKVTRPGRGSLVSVTIEKQKSGPEDIAVDLKLEEVEVTSPATGEVISDLVVLPTGPSAPILCRRVLHAEPGLTAKGVFDRVTRQRIDPCNPGVTFGAVKAALSRMVASGETSNDGGKYSLLARGGDE